MASTSTTGEGGGDGPPPPPQRPTCMHDLPAELFVEIIRYLHHPEDYASLALSHYPILAQHGLVPVLSELILSQIRNHSRPLLATRIGHLPTELTNMILWYLGPREVITLIFSDSRLLCRYVRLPISPETVRLFERWRSKP